MYSICYYCRVLIYLNLIDIFSKNILISNFIKSVQWEQSCAMGTDRRTDMTKLIVVFRNFSKRAKKHTVL